METKIKTIPLEQLKIDRSHYQRDQLGEKRISSIADNFSDVACTPLLVGEREDGSLWIVDGQQRKAVMERMGKKSAVCSVFKSDGYHHEAREYVRINAAACRNMPGVGRQRMYGSDVFKAAAAAEMEPYVSINRYLKGKGYTINRHGGNKCIGFVSRIVVLWNLDETSCRKAFNTL